MTCESLRSFRSIGFELVDVVLLLTSVSTESFGEESIVVRFVEDFDCDFSIAEAEEVFLRVDGFAGTEGGSSKLSIGAGIGGFLIGFLSYAGGIGIGLRDFGVTSIEFKILSSDLDRENIDDDVTVVVGAILGGLSGGKGGGTVASYDEHKLATDGL